MKGAKMAKFQPKITDELKELVDDLKINLGDIDTGLITDMSSLFSYAERKDFSGIESWDVSNVENMSEMFAGAEKFNQSLESWDISNVDEMEDMFEGASAYTYGELEK